MHKLWEKYRSMPIQAKASLWYTISSFLQRGISFIVIPIYVRLLTTAEYGEWSVFQSWAGILIVFASLNLSSGVYTKTLVDITDKHERDVYTSSMQGFGTLTTILLLVIYIFVGEWANRAIGLSTGYMLLLFLYFIVNPAWSFWSTRQRVEYKYKPTVIVSAIVAVLVPVVSVILLRATDLRAKALILGYLIVQCAVGLVFYIYHFCKSRRFYHKDYWLYAARFNIPLVPHYLSLIVLNQSDRIMIKHYCGESDAGIYSFAYSIALTINVLISAINGSRVPWTYEQLKAKTYESLRKITNMLVVFVAGIALMISLLSPEIINIMGTKDYQIAVYVIPVVTIGVFYTFVYDLYAAIEFYYGATKYVMYASMTGAILNIILNAIFIPRFGFIAAAYTTLICYIVFMLMHYLFSKTVLQNQNIRTTVYQNKTIFLISVLATIICLGSMITFPYPILRYVLFALLIFICIVKRETFKKLIMTIKK